MLLFVTKQLAGLVVGGIGIAALLIVYNTVWDNPTVRSQERDIVEAEARARAMDLIKKRSEDNEEISTFDAAQLCVELGGRWVQSDCVD